MASGGTIRIGTSGWRYPPWRGTFYPAKLAQSRELEYLASVFSAVEINGTFYSLQRPSSFREWYAQTPPEFVFALKGSRFITHRLKLRDVAIPLANFLASGLLILGEKLGPILWQFPPQFGFDPSRMRAFFELLPFDTAAAARLARRHDARLRRRARLSTDQNRPMRHAVEVRHPSFENREFVELLREFRIGLVVSESPGLWPMLEDVTADFVYLRLHGDRQLYRSGYAHRALDQWARRIRAWHRGGESADVRRVAPAAPATGPRDIYCFFDNTDAKLRAPVDAQTLMRKLRLRWPPGRPARSAGIRAVEN
jgi:uncharacterized protein YecE (DUF72 family)